MQLNLYRSEYFTVTAAGTTAVTILSYINVRANEVLTSREMLRHTFAGTSIMVPNPDQYLTTSTVALIACR